MNGCILCLGTAESVSQLLLACSFASEVRSHFFFHVLGVYRVMFNSVQDLLESWQLGYIFKKRGHSMLFYGC